MLHSVGVLPGPDEPRDWDASRSPSWTSGQALPDDRERLYEIASWLRSVGALSDDGDWLWPEPE
jgi:hypothetical protein